MMSTFTDPYRSKAMSTNEFDNGDQWNHFGQNNQNEVKHQRHQRRTASTLISENIDETSRSERNDMFEDNYDDAITPEKNLIAQSEQAQCFPPQLSRNRNSRPQLERRPIYESQLIQQFPSQNSNQIQLNSQKQSMEFQNDTQTYQSHLMNLYANNRLKDFITKPSPKGQLIQCNLKEESTFAGLFYPKYHLYTADSQVYLMTAQSQSIRGKKYAFYYDKSCEKQYQIGKIEQGKSSNSYNLITQGLKGSVNYNQNIVKPSGPKQMNVQLEMEDSKTLTCINRKPMWCPQTQIHQMKFTNRINMPSMHNFQLIQENQEEINLLQFGLYNSAYTLDFQWPLSPLQAFQIAVSSLASE